MELSYSLRLACWTLFNLGLLRLTFVVTNAGIERLLRSRIDAQTPRWQERYFFLTALAPDFLVTVVALVAAAPAYHLQETNSGAEHVGFICLLIALFTLVRYFTIAWGSMRLAFKMRLSESAAAQDGASNDTPQVLLAVAGLLRTRIVASPQVVRGELFSREALHVAIAHEESHIRNRDNLKLFILSSPFIAGHESKLVRRWRRMAERAADDDAVVGGPARAVLLAEALLAAARAISQAAPPALAMELMPFESELESRVERLLSRTSRPVNQLNKRHLSLQLFLLCLGQCSVCVLLAISHEFAEFVFRLG